MEEPTLNSVARNAVILFFSMMLIGWCYVAFDNALYTSHSSGKGSLTSAFHFLSSVGHYIPKARWFSGYFSQHGKIEFAEEVARVYGFNALVILVILFFLAFLVVVNRRGMRAWIEDDRSSPDVVARLDTIGRLALGTVIFALYFCFIGLGLETKATDFPAENADGSNVIGMSILSYSLLIAASYYAFRNRTFVRFHARKRQRK
jgi:hypothetical protein